MLPVFRLHEKLTESEIAKMDIETYLGKVIDPRRVIHLAYRNLNESFDYNIPTEFLEKFKVDPYTDHILENLQTHDSNMLIRKIREVFGLDVEDRSDVKDDEKRYMNLYLYSDKLYPSSIKKIVDSEDFQNLIDFFGYSKSDSYEISTGVIILLEPIYADDANHKVYGDDEDCSHGIIYHITTIGNGRKILKSGFRISNPEDKRKDSSVYRYYPKRTYFLAFPPGNVSIERRQEIINAINLYFSKKEIENGYCILQVDVRGLEIDFYKDSVAQGDYDFIEFENDAVYTYCNIPKERIKIVYTNK